MLLAVDCGNTNTVFSIWDGARFISNWRIATSHKRTADQYYVWLTTLLKLGSIENNIEVECLPGATALIPALVNSGIPFDKFVFEGFLPVKKGRKTRLEKLIDENRTMIFYESPHKLLKTLRDFSNCFGPERKISISREITKIYEETIRGTLEDIVNLFMEKPPKGEFVIIVEGCKN